MTTLEFLSQLRKSGVELQLVGDRLRIRAPEGVLTPSLREELAARKEEILQFLETIKGNPQSLAQISPYPRNGHLPLSYSQERLWFLDQMEPGNPAYNMPAAIRLQGILNLSCLQRALDEILVRHEVLRTNFDVLEDQPVQIIRHARALPLTFIDLSNLPFEEQTAEAKRLTEAEAKRPFQLHEDVLIRASLLKLNEEEHIFLLTMHHIVSDAWSITVFAREFSSLYNAFVNGQSNLLPPLPIQYADFAQWQRDWLQGERLETQLAYWKRQLQGELPQLEILLDKPRPAVQSHQSGQATLELSASLSQALRHLSQQEDATLFMTLLAAFKLLLYRQTGLEDIIVGSPIAGRNRAETENLIGVFLNTLVLRTDLSGNPSFRELIQRVKRVAIDSYTHQDVPFEKLLIELQPERDLSRTPLFQVFFNMLNLESGHVRLPGLTAEILNTIDIDSKFDLNVYIHEVDGVLKLQLVYNSNLFYHDQILSLLDQYEYILNEVSVDPDQWISTLPLLPYSKIEKLRISIPAPNDFIPFQITEADSISSRFRSIAETFSNHLAIKTETQQFTYQELSQASSQVALLLQHSQSDRIQQVALLFEHDAPMIVGMFGALLAGKTYVPLDPAYPQPRLEYILKHSQAKFILTNNRNLSLAKSLAGNTIHIINLDEASSTQSEFKPISIDPETPAYILFTSGSTGQPKGVVQTHRNVLLHIQNYTNNLRITASDRLTLLSSYSFDAAVMAIYGALLNGASLYPYEVNANGLSPMRDWMTQKAITIYHSTPTLFRYFMETLDPEAKFPDVRIVVLGGEEVIRNDVDLFKQHFPEDSFFINGLGPTESTLALQNILSPASSVKWGSVPVGYPVEGIKVSFLDEAGQPAPLQGEIVLQGRQVALGYWEMPALTNAVFQTHPQDKTIRMYRTGDLGRLLPDGRLLFLGRKDEQVKIRGFRIELGEIEATLNKHPAVKNSIVVARPSNRGDKRLIAYIVPSSSKPLQIDDLRNYLKQYLPDYMLPSHITTIAAIPLTPSGKVDRNALLNRENEDIQSDTHQIEARDETEEKLVKIWQNILQVEKLGVTENFFEMGGHSLMALRMFAQIKEQFNVNLPLATLFQKATIEQLATVIRNKTEPTPWSSLIGIETQGNQPPFFCVHGITGDVLWFRDLAKCLAPDNPFYGLQARGLDGLQKPFSCIEEMAEYYIQEIRLRQPSGPYYLGGASFGGTVALEIAQQLLEQGEKIALLAVFDHSPPNIKMNTDQKKFVSRLVMSGKVIRNFPYWLKEFLKLGPSRIWKRVRRKMRLVRKARGRLHIGNLEQFDATDIIDFASELPLYRQQLITSHYQAMKMYIPRAYPGYVTLFRAKSRPLLNTSDPEVGWQKLAPQRVTVIDVPSSHEGMFRTPYVNDLAEQLKKRIDQASGNS